MLINWVPKFSSCCSFILAKNRQGARGAQFGPKCHWLVQLGGPHPYHVLGPHKRPLQHSWGPQKGPLWPIKPLLVAPEALGQPQGARFGPKCHWLAQLGGPHPDHVLGPLKGPLQHSWSPQKGPLWPIKSLLGAQEGHGQPWGT